MQRIYLYGLAGSRDQYRAIWYEKLEAEKLDTQWIRATATQMVNKNPSIREVWAMSPRKGLRQDYLKSAKYGSIEDCIIFKDLCERYGLPVPFVRIYRVTDTKK